METRVLRVPVKKTELREGVRLHVIRVKNTFQLVVINIINLIWAPSIGKPCTMLKKRPGNAGNTNYKGKKNSISTIPLKIFPTLIK